MSIPSASFVPTAGAAGTPPIDAALEPASVRNGSPAVQKAYAGALEFESLLVQQLSQSLTATSGLGGAGGEEGSQGGPSAGGSAPGGDAVSSELSSLLPQTLANGVMSQGGLGLAQQLMGSLLPAGTTVPTTAPLLASSGGVAA